MTREGMILAALLKNISCHVSRLEAEILCAFALNCSRTKLITHQDWYLTSHQVKQCFELVRMRNEGLPIAYLLNRREFYGMEFFITPSVLIPRPETEFLVDQALNFLYLAKLKVPRVLELGTGSGAISISLKKHFPEAFIFATDISSDALEIAKYNIERLLPEGSQDSLILSQGSWYDALLNTFDNNSILFSSSDVHGKACFDLILSNPPYIAMDDPHLKEGDLRFEPLSALTDYKDGLSAIGHIVHNALDWLLPGGELWVEHGYMQKKFVVEIFRQRGFSKIRSIKDFAGIERITGGCLQMI